MNKPKSSKPTASTKSNPAASPLGFQSTQGLFARYTTTEVNKYVSQEFQDFGYRLAVALGDLGHKSLYMRMAKTVDRGILERALAFVTDANAKNKARLFMWKVTQLKQENETTSNLFIYCSLDCPHSFVGI